MTNLDAEVTQAPSGARRLLRSTSTVAGMTMLSRVMGFVRDIILAQVFGAGPAFDAFVIAFKIPNFFRRLFGEGAFSQAFVPVLSEHREQHGDEKTHQFINHIAGTLGLALTVLVILVELLVPAVILIFAPGFHDDPHRLTMATHMLHVTFPYIFLIGLTAFAGAALNTSGRFAVPAFTPVLLNVALIGVAWFWAPHAQTPIYVLAWGVLMGGVVQLALQIPFLKRADLMPRPRVAFRDPGVVRVMKLMVPALFGVSVAQISLLVDNIFASFLPPGSISWLYYSDRLTYLPLGVIGVALATVVLPSLSRHHNRQSPVAFSNTVDWALRCALLIGIPAAVGLFLLAGPLLATLIHHGAFSQRDVIMTRLSLMAFSVGLPGFMLIKILASGFYSQQNIKTPVKVAVVAMILNLVLNAALIVPMRHAGLALATSISSLVNALLLLILLIRQGVFKPKAGWLIFLSRIITANVAMGVVIYLLDAPLMQWMEWHTIIRVGHLALLIGVAVLMYGATLFGSGLRPRDFKA